MLLVWVLTLQGLLEMHLCAKYKYNNLCQISEHLSTLITETYMERNTGVGLGHTPKCGKIEAIVYHRHAWIQLLVQARKTTWACTATFHKISQFKGVGLGYGRKLYFQCLLKYMVICAFDNLPQFQASWQHRLFTLDMNSFRKWLLFLLPFYSGAPCLFIHYYWW